MSDYVDTNPPTTDTPNGTFKNETQPNACDGTDIKAEHMQDPYYALYQILQLAGEMPNGELENGNNSRQFLKSLASIGWFKYDSKLEYKKNAIVIYTIDSTTKFYRSQKDNNNAPLTNTDYWINIVTINSDNTIEFNSTSNDNAGVFMGAFMYGIRNDTPEGWLRCDGTDKPAKVFMSFINNFLLSGKIPYKNLTDWQTEYNANNGNCGYFGYQEEIYDEELTDENGALVVIQEAILRTPCFKDEMHITAALNSGNICKFNKAGLPNLTWSLNTTGDNGVGIYTSSTDNIKLSNAQGYRPTGTGGGSYRNADFDASISSDIYGNSDTVTTDNTQYPVFICVSNKAVPVTESEYNGFIDGLTNKINLNGNNAIFDNLSEIAKINISSLIKNYIFSINYAAGIAIGNGGIAPSAGIVKFCSTGGANNDRRTGWINGVQVWQHWSGNNNNNGYMESTANIVKGGDVITYNGNTATFYPFTN